LLPLALLTVAIGLPAQAQSTDSSSSSAPVATNQPAPSPAKAEVAAPAPFSRLAIGGGISAMGINLQAAVNANRYINIRGIGNVFSYSINNINTNGLTLNGKLNFATAGAAVDFYPFPNHGLRFSPGVLMYNQNNASVNMTASSGTSFTLNSVKYYSSSTDPITGTGNLGLNKTNPAFTMTTGWGNMISRRGGHFSVPFELGAAFTGPAQINMVLAGHACNAQGLNCVNVAKDPTVQSNLQAQITKYQNDVNKVNIYPIFSIGIGYNFKLR